MSLALQSKGREQPGAQRVLGVTVKSSFLHGTLWFGAAWEGGGVSFPCVVSEPLFCLGDTVQGSGPCVFIF